MAKKKAKNRVKKTGLPPGTLVHTGEKYTDTFTGFLYQYNSSDFNESTLSSDVASPFSFDDNALNWLVLEGVHHVEYIQKLGNHLEIPVLILEDILNTNQRPKVEFSDGILFVTLRYLKFNAETKSIDSEQISIVVKDNVVLTFCESTSKIFAPLLQRIQNINGRFRTRTAYYLMYAIIDLLVDHYIDVLEENGLYLDELEDALFNEVSEKQLAVIQSNKKDLMFLRKTVYPVRELIASLKNNVFGLFTEETTLFLNDVHDHCLQIIETVDSQRELNNSLKDMYLSNLSNRMNKVMQVLTIISTIFIPLSFLAGVYGMNFSNMPELHTQNGYFVLLTVMFTIAVLLLLYFRSKKWI